MTTAPAATAPTAADRASEIADAHNITFDVTMPAADWTPVHRLIAAHIAHLVQLEAQVQDRRYWVQSNLDRAMAQVTDPAGTPGSLCAVDANQFNTLCGQLVAARRTLVELARTLRQLGLAAA